MGAYYSLAALYKDSLATCLISCPELNRRLLSEARGRSSRGIKFIANFHPLLGLEYIKLQHSFWEPRYISLESRSSVSREGKRTFSSPQRP
jgi:hypothetical protein